MHACNGHCSRHEHARILISLIERLRRDAVHVPVGRGMVADRRGDGAPREPGPLPRELPGTAGSSGSIPRFSTDSSSGVARKTSQAPAAPTTAPPRAAIVAIDESDIVTQQQAYAMPLLRVSRLQAYLTDIEPGFGGAHSAYQSACHTIPPK